MPSISLQVSPTASDTGFGVTLTSDTTLGQMDVEFISAGGQKDSIQVQPQQSDASINSGNVYAVANYYVVLKHYLQNDIVNIPTDGTWNGKTITINGTTYIISSLTGVVNSVGGTDIYAMLQDKSGNLISNYTVTGITAGNSWSIYNNIYAAYFVLKQGITAPGYATITANCADSFGNTAFASTSVTVLGNVVNKPGLILNGVAGNNNIDLKWNFTQPDEYKITGYNIYRTNGSGYASISITSGNSTAFRDSGVNSGTAYSYYLIASEENGAIITSNQTNNITPTSVSIVTPGAPVVSANTGYANQAVLNWQVPVKGTYDISNYIVYKSTYEAQSLDLSQALTCTSNSFQDNIATGQYNYYRVAAIDVAGNTGLASDQQLIYNYNLPTAPQNLSGQFSGNCIQLTWTASSGGTYPLDGYLIYKSTVANVYINEPVSGYNPVTTTSYIDCNVNSRSAYYYMIKAKNTRMPADLSSFSNQVLIKNTILPGTPQNLTATTGFGSADLSWLPSDPGSNTINNYAIMRSTGAAFNSLASSQSTSYSDAGVNSYNSYSYYVYAVDSAGLTSSASNIVSMQPYKNPDAPQNITITPLDASINLKWNAVQAESSPVSSYNIYRSTAVYNLNGFNFVTSVTTTSFTDINLSNNDVTYYYYLTVSDTAGNKSLNSNIVSAIPFLINTTAPTSVTAVAGDANVALSWSQAQKGTYNVTGYNIYHPQTQHN